MFLPLKSLRTLNLCIFAENIVPKMAENKLFCFLLLCITPCSVFGVPFVVQTLSSRYAIVLGGYGFQYEELSEVDIVRHDKICPNVIR